MDGDFRPLGRKRQCGPRLYYFQLRCVGALMRAFGEHRAPILQAATGAGKTVILAEIVRRAAGQRVLVLAHRRELVRQTSKKLTNAGVAHGIIAPGFEPTPAAPVQVASVQTVVRRLDKLADFDLIVIDEAHHAVAATYRAVVARLSDAKLLGLTATPARLDGRGLGVEHGGLFDAIVCGPPIAELIEDGYLTPVRCFSPTHVINTTKLRIKLGDYDPSMLAAAADRTVITGDAVKEYRRHADHQPAMAFSVSVKHAQHVAAAFREEGYRAECVHGGLPTSERDRLIAGLGTGDIEILASCEILGEGLDVPAVGAVILLRPTMSLTVHLQQIGRGLRPAPGKRELVVLDHAGNVARHGLPDHDRVWTLDGVEERRPGETRVKTCPGCRLIVAAATRVCPCCGHVFWVDRRVERTGTLTEIRSDAALLRLTYEQIMRLRLSEAQLRLIAEARGYRPGWVWHRLQEQRQLVEARR